MVTISAPLCRLQFVAAGFAEIAQGSISLIKSGRSTNVRFGDR